MKCLLLVMSLFVYSFNSCAQLSYGLMYSLTNTTFNIATGDISLSQNGEINVHTKSTGYALNHAIGIYGLIKLDDTKTFGLELFYDKTTSLDLKDLVT